MLAVRFLGRLPALATPIKRTSCLRLVAGLASGGSALTVAWKHYRVHALSPPKTDGGSIRPIVRDVQEKRVQPSTDKFDWNLFWYYLRPQIWIIACATAVSSTVGVIQLLLVSSRPPLSLPI